VSVRTPDKRSALIFVREKATYLRRLAIELGQDCGQRNLRDDLFLILVLEKRGCGQV
jgi:hypothetical protein